MISVDILPGLGNATTKQPLAYTQQQHNSQHTHTATTQQPAYTHSNNTTASQHTHTATTTVAEHKPVKQPVWTVKVPIL